MKTKKIVCVWIGTAATEEALYHDYLNFDYDDEGEAQSPFGNDAELEFYEEDFMESWWFEKLSLDNIIEYKDNLLDAKYFFDDLLAQIKTIDLNNRNFISFLFGETGNNAANEILFDYKGIEAKSQTLAFVFRKEYVIN